MVLLINSDINRYIPTKFVIHNICYFKYAFKLQFGHYSNGHTSPQKVPPLYECLGSILGFVSIYIIFYFCLRLIYLLYYCIYLLYKLIAEDSAISLDKLRRISYSHSNPNHIYSSHIFSLF